MGNNGQLNNIGDEIKVNVSRDQLMAYMTVSEPKEGDEPFTVALIMQKLASEGIINGILENNIVQFLKAPVYGTEILIAKGSAPAKGADGESTYYFDRFKNDLALEEREDGTVNYKEVNVIQNVRQGTKLFGWTEPTQGESGMDVFGNVLEGLFGAQAIVPQGENTEVDQEKKILLATSDGQVVYETNRVCVKELFVVNGDLDLSVGDIFFWGSVLVKGQVREGFKIVAEGDVTVRGSIEAAQIRSGGNVYINDGVNGMGRGKINCDGDLVCKYIENCNIKVKGNVVADAILHSIIDCEGNLQLKGRRQSLIGCECEIGGLLVAKNIGSKSNPNLKLEFKTSKKDEKNGEMDKKLKQLLSDHENRKKKIDFYGKMMLQGKLNDSKKNELAQMIKQNQEIQAEIETLEQQIKDQVPKEEEEYRDLIKCSGVINEGVKITVGSANFNVDNDLPYCNVYFNGSEIAIQYGRN